MVQQVDEHESGVPAAVSVSELEFTYPGTRFRLEIPAWRVARGGHLAVIGPSGSGKTTLLHLIAGIYLPAAGRVVVDGVDLAELGDAQRRSFRLRRIGFVFQDFQLLDYLSVLENIVLPYLVGSSLRLTKNVWDRAAEVACAVGLEDKLGRNVIRLSHGERQRVALCRALVPSPNLILADEPTGNLDPANKRKIIDLLHEQARCIDAALIVVTHDRQVLDSMDDVVDFDRWTAKAG